MRLVDHAIHIPLRTLQVLGVVAGWCMGMFVVGAILTACLMGAWMTIETLYFLAVAITGG